MKVITKRNLAIVLVFGFLLFTILVKLFVTIQEKNKVARMAEQIQNPGHYLLLRDLAEIGTHAVSAGPAVLALLEKEGKPYPYCKICAVRTLGYIGYKEATGKLIGLLDDDQNWPMVFVAVESLGMMKATEAIPALTAVSKNYWFSTVRSAAEKALRYINTGDRSIYRRTNHFPSEYFAFESADPISLPVPQRNKELCEKVLKEKIADNTAIDSITMEKIPYTAKNKDKTRKGIMVDGGYIFGTNHGEFGGNLVFVDASEEVKEIGGTHIVAIVTSPTFGIVVASGLAHLGPDTGYLFKLVKDEKNKWQIINWFDLPGEPNSMELSKDALYIKTRKGNVAILGDGSITECD